MTINQRTQPMPLTLNFAKSNGLVPAIIQHHVTGEVLMLGFMNALALAETQHSGQVTFFSRSRNQLWKKGESSGHVLQVREILTDCDADALLIRVDPLGPGVCHEGYRSCFFRRLENGGTADGERFNTTIIAEKTFDPSAVYSQSREKK
jgi:phosphoribosyl-AMP cyclohydrolase